MKLVLRPIPVVFACRGCPLDAPAQAEARAQDERGEGEAALMGADAAKARSRYPIFVIEGCAQCCATRWLAGLGVVPQETRIIGKSGSDPDFQSGSEPDS